MTNFGKLIFGILILIVFGGVYFFISDKSSQVEIVQEEVATTTPSTGKKMAFKDFFALNTGSYECEVMSNQGEEVATGTIYIKQQLLKGDFITIINGQSVTSNLLINNGYSYAWSSLSEGKGIKTEIEATSTATTSWDTPLVLGDYNCKEVALEDSFFNVPSNVTFSSGE